MKFWITRSLIILFSSTIVYFFYLSLVSFRYQYILRNEFSTGDYNLDINELDNIPLFPNISVTSLPMKALIANYYFVYGYPEKAVKYLDEGSKVNPHIFFPEYLKAKYYFLISEFDSAHFYAKKAFYGWPKSIEHYKIYNQTLEQRRDTIEILNAYKAISKYFYDDSAYKDNFIDSYTNAQLRYMISEYPDAESISIDKLEGKWQKIFEFEGGRLSKQDIIIELKNNIFTSNVSYYYKKNKDTLDFFFLNNRSKPISKVIVKYSPKYQTLILKQTDSTFGNDSFYKRIK